MEFNKEVIKQFLLSTRFLFQGLDRVQFFSKHADLIGDTNILDLDTSVLCGWGGLHAQHDIVMILENLGSFLISA